MPYLYTYDHDLSADACAVADILLTLGARQVDSTGQQAGLKSFVTVLRQASGPAPEVTLTAQGWGGSDLVYPPGGGLPSSDIGALLIGLGDSDLLFQVLFDAPIKLAQVLAADSRAEMLALLTKGGLSFTGSAAPECITGGTGADTMYASGGKDRLDGAGGRDLINGDADADRLFGGAGNDLVYGGTENDTVEGGAGNDLLHGGDGRDHLSGGSGDDRLFGALGADRLTGGKGADDFAYAYLPSKGQEESGPGARDVITDFRPGVDEIDLSLILSRPFVFRDHKALTGAGQIRVETQGRNTLVQVSTDADRAAELEILLVGRHDLDKGDFVL